MHQAFGTQQLYGVDLQGPARWGDVQMLRANAQNALGVGAGGVFQ